MKHTTRLFALPLVMSCTFSSIEAETMYIANNGNENVYAVDINSQSATLLGSSGINIGFGGLGFAQDGTLYGWENNSSALYTVNTTTGLWSSVGGSGPVYINTFDINPLTNEAIGTDDSPFSDELYSISLADGSSVLKVGLTNFVAGWGSAFGPDGTLYYIDVGGDNIRSLDINSGLMSLVGATGVSPTVTNLSYNPDDDMLYAVETLSNNLYRFNPNSGAGVNLGPIANLPITGQYTMGTIMVADPSSSSLILNGSFEHGLYDDGTPLPGVINPTDGTPRNVTGPPNHLGDGDDVYVLENGATAIDFWEVFSTSPKTIDWVHTDVLAASDGVQVVDLNGTPGPGGIRQTFSTIPGKKYEVVFDLAGNPETLPPPEPVADPIKIVRVSAAGQSADFSFDTTSTTPTSMGWEGKSWTFVADSSSATLSFESLTPTYPGATPANLYVDFGPVIDKVGAFEGNYAADFDGSGAVTGIDFLKWQQQFGSAGIPAFSGADATGDGSVDDSDYSVWESQLGNVSAAIASSAIIPEPSSLLLATFASLTCCSRRRR